jgi:hypothetical protein
MIRLAILYFFINKKKYEIGCNMIIDGDQINVPCEFEFWFSPDTPVSATNKTDLHDITEILLKVAFNIITLILTIFSKTLTQRVYK